MPNCIVPDCSSRLDDYAKEDNIIFHLLPEDDEKCALWLENLGLKQLIVTLDRENRSSLSVCSAHFHTGCYKFTKTLKEDAVPSLNIIDMDEEVPCAIVVNPDKVPWTNNYYLKDKVRTIGINTEVVNKNIVFCATSSTQTPQKLSDNTPRKRKLKTDVREAAKRLRMLEQRCAHLSTKKMTQDEFIDRCNEFLNPKVREFVKCQIQKKIQGNRFHADFKSFCSKLYHCSPQAYKLMQETFYLPSERTLRRFRNPKSSAIDEKNLNGIDSSEDIEQEMAIECGGEGQKLCTTSNGVDTLDANE